MKWKAKEKKSYEEEVKKLSEWHKWFAWHPIKTTDNNWIWLEDVHRYMYDWKYITMFTGIDRYFWVFPIIFWKYYRDDRDKLMVISNRKYKYKEALTEFEGQMKDAIRGS